jgi:septal ring-binding cell division protein DamX
MGTEDSWDCVQESDPDSRRPERLPEPAEPPQPPAAEPPPPVQEPSSPPVIVPQSSGSESGVANIPTEARETVDSVPTEPAAATTGAAQTERPMKLADVPGDYYAVQLVALDSIAAVEAYVNDHQLEGLSAARIAKDDRLFYVLLLGVYADRPTAQAAVEQLPTSLAGVTPWIRPMRTLQAAMRRAEELEPSQLSAHDSR